jgi:hypothetical protein
LFSIFRIERAENDGTDYIFGLAGNPALDALMAGAGRDVVGILRGAVSGQLMVSDQAARSIG